MWFRVIPNDKQGRAGAWVQACWPQGHHCTSHVWDTHQWGTDKHTESSHTQRVNIYSLPPLLDTVFVVYSISFTCFFNLLSSFPVEQTWAGLQRVPTWCERFSFLGIFLDCHLRYTFVISFQDLLLVSTFFLFHFLLTFEVTLERAKCNHYTKTHYMQIR